MLYAPKTVSTAGPQLQTIIKRWLSAAVSNPAVDRWYELNAGKFGELDGPDQMQHAIRLESCEQGAGYSIRMGSADAALLAR